MLTPYRIASLEEVESLIDPLVPLSFDTETCGFYGRIRLGQFYQPHWPMVILVEWPNAFMLAAMLGRVKVVAHNGHYDFSTIQANTGTRWAPNEWEDTFLLARLAFAHKEGFALDEVMTYVLKKDPYLLQNLDKKSLQTSNWNVPVLTGQQLLYAATDVYHLPAVYDVVSKQLDALTYRLDKLAVMYSLDFQNNGFPVDKDRLQNKYKANLDKIAEIALPINCNSYQQVRKYIDSNMSDDLGLVKLANQGNDRAANVRTTRKLKKQNSFMDKFDTDDGRIYGHFAPNARSGRFTCKDQNLQQLPRALKDLFGVSEESNQVLIFSDYAQIQLRGACVITKERRMEKLFRNGEDLHDFTATLIFGGDWEKKHRQVSKTGNFNLLFAGGAEVFCDILLKQVGFTLPLPEAQAFKTKWKNLWSSISQWQDEGALKWRRKQLGQTPFGRSYYSRLLTDFLAMEIQGFESEVAKLALHYLMPRLKELNEQFGFDEDIGFRLCNFIHDSFILQGPNEPEAYQAAAKLLSHCMQEAWFEGCKAVPIKDLPMPVDTRVGFNWGDIENGIFFHQYKLTGLEEYKEEKVA